MAAYLGQPLRLGAPHHQGRLHLDDGLGDLDAVEHAPVSGSRWAAGENLRDKHRRVLQTDERMGLTSGQDEHLAGLQFAGRTTGGERDSALKAVDRYLPRGLVGGNHPASRQDQPPGRSFRTNSDTAQAGITWPCGKTSRWASSVGVCASVLDDAPASADPRGRTSIISSIGFWVTDMSTSEIGNTPSTDAWSGPLGKDGGQKH
jgi:hypothetical protein